MTTITNTGRLELVRTIADPDGLVEDDWSALQAVPENVERATIDPQTRATKDLFIVAVARDANGDVVTGTVSMQLVSIDLVGGLEVVGGAAVEAAVPTGAGVLLPSAGAHTCTIRVVATAGLAAAATLRIYMRRAS